MLIPWIVLMLEGLFSKLFLDLIPNNSDMVSMIVIVINSMSLCVGVVFAHREKHDVIYMMLGGFLLRLGLFYWDLKCRNIFLLPASGYDTEKYALWAKNGLLTGHFMRNGVYPGFITFWYSFFRVQRPIAQYINILLAMTAISLVISTMKYLEIDERVARKVIALMCFLPYSAIMHSILLRETLIMFLIVCSVCFFVRYIKDGGLLTLIASMAIAIAASMVHSGAIAVLLGEAVALILYDRQKRTMRVTPKSVALTIAFIVGFMAMYVTLQDVIFDKFNGVESAEDIVNHVSVFIAGGSAYDVGFNIDNGALNLIVNSPIRMLYFIASPLPWDWRGVSDIVAFFFSTLFFLYTFFRAFVEIRKLPKGEERSLIIIFTVIALCGALIFAWGVSNAGTAMRHREKFTMVFMLLLALCNDGKIRRRQSLPVRRKIGNDYES